MDGGAAGCEGHVPSDVEQRAHGSHRELRRVDGEAEAAADGGGGE